MERDPTLPAATPAPHETPSPVEGKKRGFFEHWRDKTNNLTELEPQKKKTPEVVAPRAPHSERRALGKNILGLTFGRDVQKERERSTPTTSEVLPRFSEETPQLERAARMRRFARVVIARVLGEAAQEPQRSRDQQESQPLTTEPLIEAAHELRDATDDLNEMVHESRQETTEPTASERIDDRLRQLEESGEVSRRATIAAVGLGVLAVILTGTEYLSRKHTERDAKQSARKPLAMRDLDVQRAQFDRLRDAATPDMERRQRQEYYEQLSTFTHSQAERTRAVTRELQGAADVPELVPLVRVENADTIERTAGQQTGSAGTGFFGGGSGITDTTGRSARNPSRTLLNPNSPEVRKLEQLRSAEQVRLQRNAWLYGAALFATLVAAVVAAIVIG
jgi:hypothetical protein